MCHIAVVRVGKHRVVRSAADDAVEQEYLPAMLVGIADALDKDGLLHQVDAHGDLHSLVGDRLFSNIENQPVLRCLKNHISARVLILSRMRDERDIRARILMEAQHLVKVHIVDETAVCEQNIVCRGVLDKVKIMIEILEIALTLLRIIGHRRKVEEPVVAACQIPILAGTQMIEDRARLIGEHHAHLVYAGIDHARQGKVNQAVSSGKGNGFHRTAVGKFTNQRTVLLQIDQSHNSVHRLTFPFTAVQPTCCSLSAAVTVSPSGITAICDCSPTTCAPASTVTFCARMA